jgi:hypothetical protein
MDRWTDMAKPVVASHNYVANMPTNGVYTKFIQKLPVRLVDTLMFH